MQEALAKSTNLALILVDYKGKPLSHHSDCRPFCQLVRNHPEFSIYCEKCDARGGMESVRTGKPFIYRCHFDIIDLAIPIYAGQHFAGSIMAGQVRVSDIQSELEQVLQVPDSRSRQEFLEQHKNLFDEIPILSMESVQNTAELLFQLSDYIVSEAIKKDYLIKTYKNSHLEMKQINTVPLELIKQDVSETLLNQRLQNHTDTHYRAQDTAIQPAIDYIFSNKSQNLSLEELSKICNLSPNYVSRLFSREFGKPLSKIYRQWKMTWAKDLLTNTNLTITEISNELGYVDASYFVRVFKKHSGLSPLKYRESISQ